ncbi:hypothetical protein SLEP1_g6733 [Rubroshorea leprosula]|uniref:Uncharacterized protein n=1 Tax=Rubroshorea leprosula TaxID=152421 RepID=A0AAV5I211_9ROSI|nr:hypothetical protein SLEP1_g6733 [Rubroshorea leprosula]
MECPLLNLKHANKYNHEKQLQYGNQIDVSSIGHDQCYKPPTGRHTIY